MILFLNQDGFSGSSKARGRKQLAQIMMLAWSCRRRIWILATVIAAWGFDAEAQDARWWPRQAAPKALVRTVETRKFSQPVKSFELLVQSVAGLAAKAVNDGRGDELVWVATESGDLENWYGLITGRQPTWEIRGTFEPWELVDRYVAKGIIKGYVLYTAEKRRRRNAAPDDELNQSVNVATSVAGLLDGVLVDESLQEDAESHGLRLLHDARNLSPADCFATFKDRLNRRMLCAQDPRKPHARDLAIAHQVFTLQGDDKLMAEALAWLEPLSPVLGWNGGDEFETTRRSSIYGHIQTATDWCLNLPVLMADSETAEPRKAPQLDPRKLDWNDNRSAVAFVLSDGDNVQWFETNFFAANQSYWGNPDRGKMPFGWSCCFAHLRQLGPAIIEHALATRCETDEFIEWGGGYYYPDLFAQERSNRWELLAAHAAKTWALMRQNGTLIIGFNVANPDSDDARRSYEVFARETDGLLAIFVFQYSPYEGGGGKTYWVRDRRGIEIPVITARYSIWEHTNLRPRSGTPAKVACEIRESVAASEAPRYDWVIVHAWSYFQRAEGYDENAENMPQGKAAEHDGVRGYTPANWCAERLPPNIRVVGPAELVWRLRMRHNPEETQRLLNELPP
jgi:hypothetical protein